MIINDQFHKAHKYMRYVLNLVFTDLLRNDVRDYTLLP